MTSPVLAPILIAEDDPNDLFLVMRHLNRAQVSNPLVTFGDGEEVIAYLRDKNLRSGADQPSPRLLFLDIKMPRCDGFQVLTWLHRQDSFHDLKVVVLSGSDEPRDVARARELGAFRYLTKYPPPHVFAEVVAHASAS